VKKRAKKIPVLLTREKGTDAPLINLVAEDYAALLAARRRGKRGRIRFEKHEVTRHRFKHHALYREIGERYCRAPEDRPVLVTKEHAKQLYIFTIDPAHFAELAA